MKNAFVSVAPDRSDSILPLLNDLPALYRVDDFFDTIGVSTGYSADLEITAFGEFVERRAFELNFRNSSRAKLREVKPKALSQKLLKLFQQTSESGLAESVEQHKFELVGAINVLNGTEVLYPSVCLNIARHTDDAYAPSRDTSGCSIHFDADQCFKRSLLEFVERQSLIACWALGTYSRKLILPNDAKISTLSKINNVCTYLQRCGELHIADISVFEGVYVVLAAFSSNEEASAVKYAVGASAHFSPEEAVSKAVLELYQGFVLMASLTDKGKVNHDLWGGLDGHMVKYAKANYSSTYSLFRPFSEIDDASQSSPLYLEDYLMLPPHHALDVLEVIREYTNFLIYYTDSFQLHNKIVVFGRITSPDFFHAMDLSTHANLDNLFVKKLGKVVGDINTSPIPFA